MKKKRSVWKIILIVFACILLLLLLLAAAAYIYINVMLDKIDRTEITGNLSLSEEEIYDDPTVDEPDSLEYIDEAKQDFENAQKLEIPETKGVSNILLIGTDRHGANENGRSDSMMLVSFNYDTQKIHITSLMRAMYVCIPRPDGQVWGMLNAAYSWGGPNLLVDTVELNFRIKIDHYVVVNIAAFEKAVDLLGGVEITLSELEAAHVKSNSGIITPAGTQLLNGAQARAYCQIRYIDNDFVRTSRQRKVIMLLMNKVKGADLGTVLSLADQILPLVNANVSNSQIIQYATGILPMLNNPVTQRMLPIENESGKTYTGIIYVGGREMYKVDFETNIKALHEFIQS